MTWRFGASSYPNHACPRAATPAPEATAAGARAGLGPDLPGGASGPRSGPLMRGRPSRPWPRTSGTPDPGFTLLTYTHLMPASEERTRAAIDALFGPWKVHFPAKRVTTTSRRGRGVWTVAGSSSSRRLRTHAWLSASGA
ncbi:hypothetical protein KRMM14A1004_44530 [Krasilnikovia sp. MM14-A1004]